MFFGIFRFRFSSFSTRAYRYRRRSELWTKIVSLNIGGRNTNPLEFILDGDSAIFFLHRWTGNVVQLIISELRCWLQQSSRPFVSLRENGKCHVLLMISELRCWPQRSSRPPAICCKPKVVRRATLHRRFGISFRSSCSQGLVVGLGTWEAASSDFFRVPPQRSV